MKEKILKIFLVSLMVLIVLYFIPLFLDNDISIRIDGYKYNSNKYVLSSNTDYVIYGKLNKLSCNYLFFKDFYNSYDNQNIIFDTIDDKIYVLDLYELPDVEEVSFDKVILQKSVYKYRFLVYINRYYFEYKSLVHEFEEIMNLNEIIMYDKEVDINRKDIIDELDILLPIINISYLAYNYGKLIVTNDSLYIQIDESYYEIKDEYFEKMNDSVNSINIACDKVNLWE